MTAHFHDEWVHMKKAVAYAGKDRIVLMDDLTAHWSSWTIRVKAGYESDGASIPRAAWRVAGHPFEEVLGAALVHDILYDTEWWPRDKTDDCFRDLMKACGVGPIRRGIIYRAVRLGGGFTWKKHTDESKAAAREFLSVSYA